MKLHLLQNDPGGGDAGLVMAVMVAVAMVSMTGNCREFVVRMS